jgi:hypothetical protein
VLLHPEIRGADSINSVFSKLVFEQPCNDFDIKKAGTISNTFLSELNGPFEDYVKDKRK